MPQVSSLIPPNLLDPRCESLPPAPQDHHATNLAWLTETIAGGKIRCEHGINWHLG
jgi:hypothetical protein